MTGNALQKISKYGFTKKLEKMCTNCELSQKMIYKCMECLMLYNYASAH